MRQHGMEPRIHLLQLVHHPGAVAAGAVRGQVRDALGEVRQQVVVGGEALGRGRYRPLSLLRIAARLDSISQGSQGILPSAVDATLVLVARVVLEGTAAQGSARCLDTSDLCRHRIRRPAMRMPNMVPEPPHPPCSGLRVAKSTRVRWF